MQATAPAPDIDIASLVPEFAEIPLRNSEPVDTFNGVRIIPEQTIEGEPVATSCIAA